MDIKSQLAKNHFRYSSKTDISKTEKCLDLLTEKGVYPYDYTNAFEKFNEEQLPSKEQFYSRLSEEDITNDDCNRAKQIRKHFNIKNMGVYRDLYLQTDALLLTYVLEKIRDTCSKLTVVEIDLDYNQEMYAMVEAGLRGGMTHTTCKKVEANSK